MPKFYFDTIKLIKARREVYPELKYFLPLEFLVALITICRLPKYVEVEDLINHMRRNK